jgi:hypothetical protein
MVLFFLSFFGKSCSDYLRKSRYERLNPNVMFSGQAAVSCTVRPLFFQCLAVDFMPGLTCALGQIVACRAVRRLKNTNQNIKADPGLHL